MTRDPVYRRATRSDLPGASRAHAKAFNALNLRHGYGDQRYPTSVVNPYLRFAVDEPRTAFWVADEGGSISGIGVASAFDGAWFLSHLFVDPNSQGRGIGRSLLERTLDDGRVASGRNRVLITMAYNPVSLGLYAQYGLSPRNMIYRLEAAAENVEIPKGRNECAFGMLEEDDEPPIEEMRALDRETLGWHRDWHHGFFLSQEEARCIVDRRGGRLAAYAYVWSDGRIGPAAGATPTAFREIVRAGLLEARRGGSERVSTFVAADDLESVNVTAEAGLRIVLPFVFVSAGPIPTVERYLFHSPGLM